MSAEIIDIICALLLLLGAILSVAAGVGLLRFPDPLSRMHAATKPQILGLLAMLTALALDSGSWATVLAILPVVAFQLITTPMAAHMLGRAGYRVGRFRGELLYRDELEDDIARASKEKRPGKRSGRSR
ncbi:MAG: sodium:proton antiporter [Naasia sp.]|nr:sodium:proton antiporter [Naasia sp.]